MCPKACQCYCCCCVTVIQAILTSATAEETAEETARCSQAPALSNHLVGIGSPLALPTQPKGPARAALTGPHPATPQPTVWGLFHAWVRGASRHAVEQCDACDAAVGGRSDSKLVHPVQISFASKHATHLLEAFEALSSRQASR